MSKAYTEYIVSHRENVAKAYDWLKKHKIIKGNFEKQIMQHDASKYSDEEYDAYDKYFYGKEKTEKVESDFNYAWLHHIHENPHHWQYWVLKHDDEPEEALEMPYEYVIEMICDCVCAGMARSGEVRDLQINPDILALAVKNTVDMCKNAVELEA